MTQAAIQIGWEAAGVIGGAVIAAAGAWAAYMRLMVQTVVSNSIDRALNGKYVPQPVCDERHEGFRGELASRLDRLEDKLDKRK